MRFGTTVAQSVRSLAGNPVRSGLTVLGVVIGIAAVIAVVGLGKGLQQMVAGSLSALDANRITVTATDPSRPVSQRQMGDGGGPPAGGPGMGDAGAGSGGASTGASGGFQFATTTPSITPADITAMAAVPGVAAVSPDSSQRLDVATVPLAAQATGYDVVGVAAPYAEMKDYEVATGTWLTPAQVADSAAVVVLGAQAANELFPAGDAVGQTIYVADQPMSVVGVLASETTSAASGPATTPGAPPAGGDPRNNPDQKLFTGYLQWATLTGASAYSSVIVDATSEDAVAGTSAELDALVRSNHGIAADANADVTVSTAADVLAARSQITSGFTSTLTGIAAVSLLVGGIGIMNIMLVTVTERTREIGLRRAVGAKSRTIAGQFLTEAVVLTLIGGILGLGLGYLLGNSVTSWLPSLPGARGGQAVSAVMDPHVALLAVGISVAIGVVFGLFPAVRAARLDPAMALRRE